MWAELPLFVETAKEGWKLPSYIIVISQIANIGPLLFVIISCLAPQTKPKLEKVTSFVVIIISMVSSFLLAFFWKHTSYVGGDEHSTALLTLNFFLAIGDCTSSVSFYAFMSHMKPEYMATLFVGEGLSGMIPAVLAIIQGAGDIKCNGTIPMSTEPKFSVRVYFFILTGIILLSGISFLLLNLSSYCKSEMIDQSSDNHEKTISQIKKSTTMYGTLDNQDSKVYSTSYTGQSDEPNTEPSGFPQENADKMDFLTSSNIPLKETNEPDEITYICKSIKKYVRVTDIPMWKFFLYLFIIVLINMTLTSFLSSIQIYSVLPYGLDYYHLTATLPQIANPMASFFALLFMAENTGIILTVTLLGQVCVGYLIYAAAMSPTPPLHGESGGGEVSVVIWIVVTLLLVYAKVCIAGILRRHGRNALIWAGAFTQIGALIGALVGYVLVNEYNLFKDAPYCP
uniref:Riboflavin transporter n=1 Tax=Arion vulgaris TaxID=1028688 RepID=A0A0B6ZZR7_9EUPU